MQHRGLRICLWLALTGLPPAALAGELALEQYTNRPLRGVSVEALAWQAGLWRSEDGQSWQFVACPAGGLQLGLQHDLDGERTRFFEFQRYEEHDGGVVFLAQPLGREPTPFVLVELDVAHAVFENVAHDYPQRILLRVEEGVYSGRIEGEVDGEPRSAEWQWRRTADSPRCE